MREAQSLRELLQIRQHHARWLRALPDYLGSAVGYKYSEDTKQFARRPDGQFVPAVLVFVKEKKQAGALSKNEAVPPRFTLPDGRWCETDVITGALPDDGLVIPEPTADNARLLAELAGGKIGLVGGMPLINDHSMGTAACVVQVGRRLGALTNWHVAGFPGSDLVRWQPKLEVIGRTEWGQLIAPRHTRNRNDLESFTDADHRVDIGFVAFPEKPVDRVHPGVHGLGPLGPNYRLNLDSLDVIGTEVIGVGQRLGLQQGVVAAYGYEWRPDPEDATAWYATDYLILGTGNRPFAAPGDSGKLVVTADAARQPIALLWGGQREKFWADAAQHAWAYASDINLVLDLLGASILR